MRYQEQLKAHLVQYKTNILGIAESGTWRNPRTKTDVEYGYILPIRERKKNILAPYRDQFWQDFAKWVGNESNELVTLHRFFAHLNSSQALCFNLFYPLIVDSAWATTFLAEILELQDESPKQQRFEWIEDSEEETNFDYYIELKSRKKLYFEVKLTEAEFGSAKPDTHHLEKLTRIYRPKFNGVLDDRWLEAADFCDRYQLLRNMCYLGNPDNRLFIVVPRANEALQRALKELAAICSGTLKEQVRVLYLEDVMAKVKNLLRDVEGLLKKHYEEFEAKYLF